MNDEANKVLAGAVLGIDAHAHAVDLLLRALYEERARARDQGPEEFEEYISILLDSIDQSPRRGVAGEEELLERVKEHLRYFSESVQVRLRDPLR